MSKTTRGQQARETIKDRIEESLPKYCPNDFRRMALLIAYDFNLAPDTVKYRYLDMFIEKGILKKVNGEYVYCGEIESGTDYIKRKNAEKESKK